MINLIFNGIKPFSINKANYRNGNRTQAYRAWASSIHNIICEPHNQESLRLLESKFNPKKHCLLYNIVHYIPKSVFYTAKGEKSIRTNDISNIEKPLIDVISSKKYKKKYNIPILEIDDKFIKSMTSDFIAHDLDYKITVKISIIPN